jgi:uncharacterized protein YndB with AHSA1/START domain
MAESNVVTVERVIAAEPEAIFDLLADPSRHREIDGSGTVRDPRGPAVARLQLGSRFGMSMKMGVPYAMESRVIEFDEPRRIAWETVGPTRFGRYFGGRTWRYELEPVDGGTLVRETWDPTHEMPLFRPLVMRGAQATRKNMERTLDRIATIVAPAP